jgi:predicted CXXCH cytochrome family protein
MRERGSILILFLVFVLTLYISSSLEAAVKGQCSNCHTMHNSQDASAVVRGGTGVGWDGSGKLTGGSISSTPNNYLLVTNCVGCHSSTTASTIVTIGANNIPIVYNMVAPTTPLAGGNFYWVANSGDAYGHNVYGIVGADSKLSTAPGRNIYGCVNSCHDTLADPPNSNNYQRGGCQGCHVSTSHHNDSRAWYRFLKGHGQPPFGGNELTYGDYVTGVEDSDWEYTTNPSTGDHNYYHGTTAQYSEGNGLANYKTITAFCQGCHGVFHGTPDDPNAGDGMGSSSPWIRHPTDIALPTTGEYSAYDPTGAGYSTEAPVAWVDPTSPTRSEAIVMCLSCHRPHGSDQPDMLRWDYTQMVVGSGNTGGCFTCHSTKN